MHARQYEIHLVMDFKVVVITRYEATSMRNLCRMEAHQHYKNAICQIGKAAGICLTKPRIETCRDFEGPQRCS
jgi:hypothetical protein